MKNLILATFALLILASCQQQIIAYVDSGEVINEYQGKKDIEEKFKGKDDAFKKRADSIGKAFQFEVQKYNAEKPRMSKSSIQAKEQENWVIGIICPYKAQAMLVEKMLNAQNVYFPKAKIFCGTIQSFQGDE